jgi:ProP effector
MWGTIAARSRRLRTADGTIHPLSRRTVSEISTEPTAASSPEAAEPPPAVVQPDEPEMVAESAPLAAAPETATEAATEEGGAAAQERGPGPAAVAKLLAERFPAVFAPGQARPLKLKIQADIQARLETPPSRKVLSIVLQRHTTSTAYLRAMGTATQRFDLDGQPAGELAEEHRQAAQVEVERRRAIVAERRAAEREAERAAQREQHREQQRDQRQQQRAEQQTQRAAQQTQRAAQAEALVQREAEGAERAGRATLLRAFETTTLTRANFCALKGIAEAGLDAALALAREERAQRLAAVPRRDESASQADRAPQGDRPPQGERAPQGDRPPRGDRPQGPRPPRREGRPPRRGPAPA